MSTPVGLPSRTTVLLIEDDDDQRTLMAEALSARGLTVAVAINGIDGLRQMRTHHPDIVVLDLMMPDMDGWEFRVRQRREPSLADTPTIALSADTRSPAAAIDADLFLQKPCRPGVLKDAINDVLAQRQRRAEPIRTAQFERMAALGTLAAGVVHEINNPLTYVLLGVSRALRALAGLRTEANGPQLDQLGEILTSAQEGTERIRDITRGICSFSSVQPSQQTTLDVRAPLDAALGLIAHDLGLRARLIRTDRGTPFVRASEGALAQVFLNLLSNAVQALPEAAAERNEIRVTTSTDGLGRAVVEIADTGPGIPTHALPHVFDPFFTTKALGEGTGLGLSISHGIVRDLGGEIEVTSEPGHGAAFRVILPAAHATRPALVST